MLPHWADPELLSSERAFCAVSPKPQECFCSFSPNVRDRARMPRWRQTAPNPPLRKGTYFDQFRRCNRNPAGESGSAETGNTLGTPRCRWCLSHVLRLHVSSYLRAKKTRNDRGRRLTLGGARLRHRWCQFCCSRKASPRLIQPACRLKNKSSAAHGVYVRRVELENMIDLSQRFINLP